MRQWRRQLHEWDPEDTGVCSLVAATVSLYGCAHLLVVLQEVDPLALLEEDPEVNAYSLFNWEG